MCLFLIQEEKARRYDELLPTLKEIARAGDSALGGDWEYENGMIHDGQDALFGTAFCYANKKDESGQFIVTCANARDAIKKAVGEK